jgi:hypothetical protein
MHSIALPRLQAELLLAKVPKDTFPLETMLGSSYRAVIEGPTRLIKPKPFKIDPRLTDELLKDVSGHLKTDSLREPMCRTMPCNRVCTS